MLIAKVQFKIQTSKKTFFELMAHKIKNAGILIV